MADVPAAIPVAIPVVEPIVAMSVLALLHTPPVVADDNVVVLPAHTLVVPVIAAGNGWTV